MYISVHTERCRYAYMHVHIHYLCYIPHMTLVCMLVESIVIRKAVTEIQMYLSASLCVCVTVR